MANFTQPKGRKYYGVWLEPMGLNNWGGRWQCLCFGVNLRADSLSGIKQLVRDNYPGALLYKLRNRRA